MRPPVLCARLLGPVDLRSGGQQLAPLESARAESLLAYLLHRDTPQPRQRLAFLLWPGSTEAQAQTSLRKVLHILRRALPDADRLIEIGPRTLQWRADAPLWLDVEQFERALAAGRLEEAAELYAGELLEGRYDEWLADERDRLAGLYLEALERLARRHERDRRWPEAIRCAERLYHGQSLGLPRRHVPVARGVHRTGRGSAARPVGDRPRHPRHEPAAVETDHQVHAHRHLPGNPRRPPGRCWHGRNGGARGPQARPLCLQC